MQLLGIQFTTFASLFTHPPFSLAQGQSVNIFGNN